MESRCRGLAAQIVNLTISIAPTLKTPRCDSSTCCDSKIDRSSETWHTKEVSYIASKGSKHVCSRDSGSYVENLEKRAERLDKLLRRVRFHFSGSQILLIPNFSYVRTKRSTTNSTHLSTVTGSSSAHPWTPVHSSMKSLCRFK